MSNQMNLSCIDQQNKFINNKENSVSKKIRDLLCCYIVVVVAKAKKSLSPERTAERQTLLHLHFEKNEEY